MGVWVYCECGTVRAIEPSPIQRLSAERTAVVRGESMADSVVVGILVNVRLPWLIHNSTSGNELSWEDRAEPPLPPIQITAAWQQ